MTKKTTIYDIAKQLDIAAATVSRALNYNPKISKKTSKLVLETAEKMNYKKNNLALALQSGKSNTVGVIVPRINTNFFSSVITGIEEELRPEGYRVIICQTHEDEKMEIENINALLNAQVDGILMSISNVTEENSRIIQKIIQKNTPLVFFDRKLNADGINSVTINDFEGAYLATQQLIKEGCDKIAHLSGNQSLQLYEDRFLGYKKALEDNGLVYDQNLVVRSKSTVEAGVEAMKHLLELPIPPNGLFSSSDFAALGAIQELKEHGITIPKDFCVFGFGNEPFTKYMELSISTVDQSPIEMGKETAKVFLNKIRNARNSVSPETIVLIPQLQIRKSSLKNTEKFSNN